MTNIIEEIFDISKCQRFSHFDSSKIKQFKKESGAYINVIREKTITTLLISGNSSQLRDAKILIRDFLEKTSFIPTLSYFILAESDYSNNNKLKFVKFDDGTEEVVKLDDGDNEYYNDEETNDSRRTRYYIEFLQQNNNNLDEVDDNRPEDFLNLITPCQFNTFDKLDQCLERLSLKIKTIFAKSPAFPSRLILKPKIFFGKLLFFDLIDSEDHFVIQEWYRFDVLTIRGRRETVDDCTCDGSEIYHGKTVNNEFHQDSPQILDKLNILQQKFGFELDNKQCKSKGSININYVPSVTKKRKLKLGWNEKENKWKIINNSHALNRLANIDIVSGSKTPDFRLSLKTRCDVPSEGSKVEEVINDIQNSPTFTERDGMSFRSKDFVNTMLKNAVIRQVIEKERYRNKNYNIVFKKVKQDGYGSLTTQKLITLQHHTWNQEIGLENVDRFMDSIIETFRFIREMMNVLV
ncbi:hypothetical protein C1645_881860 [Glomus cerebriforme]|uniref:K Homology domain-containing protein n=1 Tax=Glomus cerebriforme TaxID=658196 RepID=A0A397S3J6_9GLOM|nr:hypothetical protein C1645_881860 [Glomus cerebriforme]